MDEYESLSHSKWECKYHVVFIPEGRRKALYGELRKYLGEVFRKLAEQKESRIEEGHLLPDHVHMMISIPPKYAVAQVIGFIKGKSAIHLARRTEAEFCRTELLGAGILRVNGRAGRGIGSRVHPHARGRRQALRSVEHVALKRPPSGGQPCRGRVSDPAQPL